MSPQSKTKEIVSIIEKMEEEKYKDFNLDLQIETPTMIQFYINNLKKGNFNILRKTPSEIYRTYLEGKMAGIAYNGTSNICVMSKDYDLIMTMNNPIQSLTNSFPWQEVLTAFTTYHEIKHILQGKGINSSFYDLFCSNLLSDQNGNQAFKDRNFHDNLYNEIDANLYGALQSRAFFSGNKEIERYFDELVARFTVQKNTFDFDVVFEKWQKNLETFGFIEENYNQQRLFKMLWNLDGTFKNPSEVSANMISYGIPTSTVQEDIELKNLCTKIISSDAYLSRIDINSLSSEEVSFINSELDSNKMILEHQIGVNRELFHDNLIDENVRNEALDILNNQINKKERYRQMLFTSRNNKDNNVGKIIFNNDIERKDSNMEYTLEDLKGLYDQYERVQLKDSDKRVLYDKVNKTYVDNKDLYDKVTFSQLWVASTMNEQSRSIPEDAKTFDRNSITDDEYNRAFCNDTLKEVYNALVNDGMQMLYNTGGFRRPEVLKDVIKNNATYSHTDDIINYLYTNERTQELYENWCKSALKERGQDNYLTDREYGQVR